MFDNIVYLEDFAPQNGQPVPDWTPYMKAAIASFPTNLDFNGSGNGGTIEVSHRPGQASLASLTNGVYRFATPSIPTADFPFGIEVNRQVVIRGVSDPGLNVFGRTQLQFAAGLGGVRLNYQHYPIHGMLDATGAKLERLALLGAGVNSGAATVHGIFYSTTIVLDHCAVQWFPGDGAATIADTQNLTACSSSLSTISDVDCNANGGNGFSTGGSDANAILFQNCKARNNGGWGFYEDSFLGCTYIGGQVASNKLGGVHAIKPGGCSAFVGVYTENDQLHRMDNPAVVMGGMLAEACLAGRNTGTARVFGSRVSGLPMRGVKTPGSFDHNGTYMPPVLANGEIGIGPVYGSSLPEVLLGLKDWQETSGAWPYRLQWSPKGGFVMDKGASGVPVFWFLNRRCTKANGFPFDISDVAELDLYGGIAMRTHVLGTTAVGMIVDDVGKTLPTDNRPLGSRRFNNSGVEGEPEYWLKTRAGWKSKGSI